VFSADVTMEGVFLYGFQFSGTVFMSEILTPVLQGKDMCQDQSCHRSIIHPFINTHLVTRETHHAAHVQKAR
jgi:hypothetical protein